MTVYTPSPILPIYILLSIKTRIETLCTLPNLVLTAEFISYYPLKQGLKLRLGTAGRGVGIIYILLSIKTRIET